MPKQNRPLVRDGRIKTKKRTDRSYLRPGTQPDAQPASPAEAMDDEVGEPDAVAETITAASESMPSRLPAAARAIQQQGMRKRREVDLEALAVADTKYAIHELRRIAILATMVVVTLIVLGIVLR